MLENQRIPDELIASSIKADYTLDVTHVTFLPLGLDINTAVYRLEDRTGACLLPQTAERGFQPDHGGNPPFPIRLEYADHPLTYRDSHWQTFWGF